MRNILYFIVALFGAASGNLYLSENSFFTEDILFDKLLSDVRIEPKKLEIYMEPTMEPTLEPFPTQSLEPSIEPSVSIETLEPSVSIETLEPSVSIETLEPSVSVDTLEPSVSIETLEPSVSVDTLEPSVSVDTLEPSVSIETLEPSAINTVRPTEIPTSYKVLDFSVNIELVNCTTNVLDEYNQNVLLSAFAEITDINKQYLSLTPHYHSLRKLVIVVLDNVFFVLDETIYISVPLINQYKTYESTPIELYNYLVILITDSIQSGLLIYTVKEYNTTVFDNTEINLLEVSDPVVRTINTAADDDNISSSDLALIIVLSSLGFIFCLCLTSVVYQQIITCMAVKELNPTNKVYSINDTPIKTILDDSPTPLVDIPEESRIVEAAEFSV